jgi:flagellar protein FliS
MNRTDLAYRRTAAEAASGLGLLIALFDTLAGDLRRAADAQRANDIERRCREVRHALLVLGYLEDWVNRGSDGVLARQLIAIYSDLRRKVIDAEVRKSSGILERQMARVLELRGHWQKLEAGTAHSGPEILPPAFKTPVGYPTAQLESRHCNWSA